MFLLTELPSAISTKTATKKKNQTNKQTNNNIFWRHYFNLSATANLFTTVTVTKERPNYKINLLTTASSKPNFFIVKYYKA